MRSDRTRLLIAATTVTLLAVSAADDVTARGLSDGPVLIAASSTSQSRLLDDVDRLNSNLGKLARARLPGRLSAAEKAAIADQNRLMTSFQKSFAAEIAGLRRKLDARLSGRQRMGQIDIPEMFGCQRQIHQSPYGGGGRLGRHLPVDGLVLGDVL